METINLTDNVNRPPPRSDATEFGDSFNEAMRKAKANFLELAGAGLAGTGVATFARAGALSVSVTQIGSSATNTTQTLKSYTLPANVLGEDGGGIEVIAWGSKANNAAPVTLALNVGGVSLNSGSTTGTAMSWVLKGRVYRRGSNVQRAVFEGVRNTLAIACSSTGDTSTDSGTMSISVTGLDASAAQSNMVCDGLIVNYFEAP